MVRTFRPRTSSGLTTHVFGLDHGAARIGHVAEAVFGPRQGDQAPRRETGEQLLTDRAVEHAARMRVVAKQERNVDDAHLGHEVGHRAGRGVGGVERAQLHALDAGALVAGVGLDLALEASVAALFEFGAEGLRADPVVRGRRGGVRDADCRLRRNGAGSHHRGSGHEGHAQGLHRVSCCGS